jgi:P-type E1-E2 ATPase
LALLGQVLELKAREKSGLALKGLLGQSADDALVIAEDGSEKTISTDLVRFGDHLRIHPGNRVPLDGIIYSGDSQINETMVTGELLSVRKTVGDWGNVKLLGIFSNEGIACKLRDDACANCSGRSRGATNTCVNTKYCR